MAKVTLRPIRPPAAKKRKRVTMHHLMNLFGSLDLSGVHRELRHLNPTKTVLLSLLATLKTVSASSDIQDAVRAYCQERGCDPSQPPIAKFVHRKPSTGDQRIYNVQYNAKGNPFLRLPLDPLGKPDRVLVSFGDGKVELVSVSV
jgi:hypothetical protein